MLAGGVAAADVAEAAEALVNDAGPAVDGTEDVMEVVAAESLVPLEVEAVAFS